MTALAVPAGLYHSPIGLYGFQEREIAKVYLRLQHGGGVMAVWDTGTGKSHLAMALSAFLFEDDLVDLVILVAEKGKIAKDEWPSDLAKYTELDVLVHHGDGRQKRLEKHGMPQVLVTTYATGVADLVTSAKLPGRKSASMVDSDLLKQILGKRVLFIFDESTLIKNRTAATFRKWNHVIKACRKKALGRVLDMTATPIEKDYEDAYNQLWMADPTKMPLNGEFEDWFVANRGVFNRATYRTAEMHKFAAMAKPMISRVRKTDPEVINEFPKQVEESRWFDLGPAQRSLYELVTDFEYDEHGNYDPQPGINIIKRMIANDPASIIHSARHGSSKIAKMLVDELGENYLRQIGSVKKQGLVDYLDPIVNGQGAKALVFSFFGPSMLPLLAEALAEKSIATFMTHGQMGTDDIARERNTFKAISKPAVLLSSDAGARGINLPQATYVVEYESALTFANRTQRINRAHRIDSQAASVTCMTFFARHTVEQSIAEGMIERNKQTDTLLDDDDANEDFIGALDRRRLLQIKTGAGRRLKPNPKE